MGVIGDEGVVVMEEEESERARRSTREHTMVTDGAANGAKPEQAKHGTASRFRKLISSLTLDDK
jgi:hypothetical protein